MHIAAELQFYHKWGEKSIAESNVGLFAADVQLWCFSFGVELKVCYGLVSSSW